MPLNFADAPTEQGGELIPAGALAFANIAIRPKALDYGKVLHEGKTNAENKYLDCEIELTSGPFVGRKVFHMLGVAGSEKWVNMSMAGIRHILEVGKKAGPQNPQGYVIGSQYADGDERMWMELDGLQCAIKVGVEKGKEGYNDKNRVATFLSPNPDSSTSKDFQALVGGATMAAGAAKSAASSGNAWAAAPSGAPAAPPPPAGNAQPPSNPMQKPGWLGSPPPQQSQPQTQGQPASGDKVPW